MEKNSRIFVAGHRGLIGSAIVRALRQKGFENLLLRSHSELDLEDAVSVRQFFESERPEFVFLAAAKVGGILANSTKPAEFIYRNLQVQNNVIHSAYVSGIRKLLFLGSSCIYPKFAPQPIKEESLLQGPLEPTNEPYAVAKIAGIRMCQAYNMQYGTNFICAMPTNVYGPNDNFHPQDSHVLAALIGKFVEAAQRNEKEVVVWGTGAPRREFLYVDDLAEALVLLMQVYNDSEIVNVGTGEDLSIKELAVLIRELTQFSGEIRYDASKPDGTPRKLLDVSRIRALGFRPKVTLRDGIRQTIEWYVSRDAAASPSSRTRR